MRWHFLLTLKSAEAHRFGSIFLKDDKSSFISYLCHLAFLFWGITFLLTFLQELLCFFVIQKQKFLFLPVRLSCKNGIWSIGMHHRGKRISSRYCRFTQNTENYILPNFCENIVSSFPFIDMLMLLAMILKSFSLAL